MLGPFRGGRVDAVSGVPGRPNEFYFGAVNGGVWKTIDAGRVWTPVFDSQPVASIGAIAVAPSAPDIVYVGSGESTLRDSMGYGNGMYKSTDAGKTWTHIGLDDTQHIGKIAVDPKNPNIVFVAAIGHLYAANPERGVFRSRDGGKTWQKVLFKNDNVGAVDVVIDPTNSQVVYAGLWNTRRPPWYTYAPTNGPGGGIFKSTDGGTTWKQLTNGSAGGGHRPTGIAIAPSNPRRVYAVVDCLVPESGRAAAGAEPAAGGARRRQSARGATQRRRGRAASSAPTTPARRGREMSADQALWGRGWYFEKVAVDPKNADIVYVPNVAVSRSKDGGKTWVPLRGSPGGDDYHQAWVSPDDSNTMIVASDQGTIITRNAHDRRSARRDVELVAQSADGADLSRVRRLPVPVLGDRRAAGQRRGRRALARQVRRDLDARLGADRRRRRERHDRGRSAASRHHLRRHGQRFDLETNVADAAARRRRRSPERRRARTGRSRSCSRRPIRTRSTTRISICSRRPTARRRGRRSVPDLTRPDPGVPPNLDAAAAATGRSQRQARRHLHRSRRRRSRAPTDLDRHRRRPDSGHDRRRQDVAERHAAARSRRGVASRRSRRRTSIANAAYASVDRHQLQDFEPYIYRTRDMGKTWQKITSGLPAGVYVHVVKEDPMRRGLLFAGTERGAFVSFDDGDTWQPLQLNLPVTSVRDFEIYGNDLIVATHGRGFWVIDDISPLRQINDDGAGGGRVSLQAGRRDQRAAGRRQRHAAAEGRAAGAESAERRDDRLLPQDERRPGPVALEILDASGATRRDVLERERRAPARAVRGGGGGRGGRGGGIPNTSALWRPTPEPFSDGGRACIAWRGRRVPAVAGGGRGGGGRGGWRWCARDGTFTAKLTVNGQTLHADVQRAGGATAHTLSVDGGPVDRWTGGPVDRASPVGWAGWWRARQVSRLGCPSPASSMSLSMSREPDERLLKARAQAQAQCRAHFQIRGAREQSRSTNESDD